MPGLALAVEARGWRVGGGRRGRRAAGGVTFRARVCACIFRLCLCACSVCVCVCIFCLCLCVHILFVCVYSVSVCLYVSAFVFECVSVLACACGGVV